MSAKPLKDVERPKEELKNATIFNPSPIFDKLDKIVYKESMQEADRFRFVPFAEQPTEPKVHIIRLQIDFSLYPFPSYEGKTSPCCKHPFLPVRNLFALFRVTLPGRPYPHLTTVQEEYKVAWGDHERLECVVENTPQVRCDCGRTFLPPQVAVPIMRRAAAIRRFFEFQKPEDLDKIKTFLPDEDVKKVRDFANSLHKEPVFIPEG